MADTDLTPEQAALTSALGGVQDLQRTFAQNYGTALGALRERTIFEVGVGVLGGLTVGTLVGAIVGRWRKP